MGHDIVRLFNTVKSLQEAKKSEYETTDQFNKRIQAMQSRVYTMGRTDSEITVAFVAPVESKYDADDGLLTVGVECIKPHAVEKKVSLSIVVRKHRSERRFVGSNAFGATASVRAVHAETYQIAFANASEWELHAALNETDAALGDGAIVAVLRSTPDEARRIRASLSALVVCTLERAESLAIEDFDVTTPTLDEPFQYDEDMRFLRVNVVGIWFFNPASGSIYTKAEKYRPTE